MSEFKVNTITNKDGSHGPQVCGITTFGSSGMQLPSGPTAFRGGRGRAIAAGGRVSPSNQTTIDVVDIATIGNSEDFGDMSTRCGHSGAVSSSTRGVVHVTFTPGSTYTNALEYITISSSGGSNDFGDRTVNTIMSKHTSGSERPLRIITSETLPIFLHLRLNMAKHPRGTAEINMARPPTEAPEMGRFVAKHTSRARSDSYFFH